MRQEERRIFRRRRQNVDLTTASEWLAAAALALATLNLGAWARLLLGS
jgi:hypothetical protein